MRTIDPARPSNPVFPEALEETRSDKTDVLRSFFIIREADAKGQGVFSVKRLAEGEIVIVGKPVSRSPERTWQTLQVDIDTHVRMDLPFEFVNHSCDPNCGVKPNRHGGYDLVAMRTIAAGEEITFDYCMTEWTCVGFQECRCHSDSCRRIIRGAKFLPLEKLEEYGGYTAPYYQSLLPELAGRPTSPKRRLAVARLLDRSDPLPS